MTLYESEATFGGHTLTDDSSGHPVDLGFQVFNLTTYPHFAAFLEALGVDSEPSEMSFALSGAPPPPALLSCPSRPPHHLHKNKKKKLHHFVSAARAALL